jgi:raw
LQNKPNADHFENEDESDSNDSVFSSGSSECSSSIRKEIISRNEMRDIYLGGSCVARTKWREELAIPILKRKKISFYLPTLHESINISFLDSKRKGETELLKPNGIENNEIDSKLNQHSDHDDSPIYDAQILDSSRILLFVITNETRSLAPMTLASHYIGMGYNVILCIQMLPENCVIGTDTVINCPHYFFT